MHKGHRTLIKFLSPELCTLDLLRNFAGEKMCTILVNCLEDSKCVVTVLSTSFRKSFFAWRFIQKK